MVNRSGSVDRQGFLVLAVHGSPVEGYYRAPTGGLTTMYHGYTIADKSDEVSSPLIAN